MIRHQLPHRGVVRLDPPLQRKRSSSTTLTGGLASLALALASHAGASLAADTSCAPVQRAVQAAAAEARVHHGWSLTSSDDPPAKAWAPPLMQDIVVGSQRHSNMLNPAFQAEPMTSSDQRKLATQLALFDHETGCKALGTARIAGHATYVYEAFSETSYEGHGGEARFRLWIDAETGLPVRGVGDAPDIDADSTIKVDRKSGAVRADVKLGQAVSRRVISTHAWIYGDPIRPPGAKGAVDPASMERLRSILRGAP